MPRGIPQGRWARGGGGLGTFRIMLRLRPWLKPRITTWGRPQEAPRRMFWGILQGTSRRMLPGKLKATLC